MIPLPSDELCNDHCREQDSLREQKKIALLGAGGKDERVRE